jgi:molybdopterin molybdotransferase
MKGFPKLTPIDDALNEFFTNVQIERLPSEDVPTASSLDRVLAKDIICPRDVPPFDRSAVDGYAVRAEDTFGASETNPIVLSVKGVSTVGNQPLETLGKGETMQIATGAPMPKGTDAVVMVEYTEVTGPDKVEVYRPVAPGENVSSRGEDVREGQMILRSGAFLKPQDIGIMSALGLGRVEVTRKPLVAVLSAGNELVDLGSKVPPGRIVDSNRPTLLAMVDASGAQPMDLGIVPDEREVITEKIREGLASANLVLVSGGTSVGERDLLPDVVNSLGRPGVIVHGIAMRPGRPTALCAVEGKPIVLLPGFPVAAMIAYEVFAEPIVLRMLGASGRLRERPTVRAVALRRVPSSPGNRSFVRVIVAKRGGGYVFEPLRATGSGVISSMVRANGMLIIPEKKEGVEEGEKVEIVLLRQVEEDEG